MKRQFVWLIAAAFLGALAYHALDRWLLPSPAQAADRSTGTPMIFIQRVIQDHGRIGDWSQQPHIRVSQVKD